MGKKSREKQARKIENSQPEEKGFFSKIDYNLFLTLVLAVLLVLFLLLAYLPILPESFKSVIQNYGFIVMIVVCLVIGILRRRKS